VQALDAGLQRPAAGSDATLDAFATGTCVVAVSSDHFKAERGGLSAQAVIGALDVRLKNFP